MDNCFLEELYVSQGVDTCHGEWKEKKKQPQQATTDEIYLFL